MTTGDELFAALSRLRDAASGAVVRGAIEERHDWRVVEGFVRRARDAHGSDGDDVVQDTLVAIARHVGELDAVDVAGAIAWATRIVRNKKIDLARARARQGRIVDAGQDEASALDTIEGEEDRPIDDRALAILVEVVEEAIAAKIDALKIASPIERQLKRTQARATLHRVLGADTSELRALLGLDLAVTTDRLHKWVERGRPLLLSVLEGLAWDHEGDAREVFQALRDAVLVRRVDAGQPRPGRRKRAEEEDDA